MNTLLEFVITDENLIGGGLLYAGIALALIAFGWTYDRIQEKKSKKTKE
jgi:hypothetical protein